MPVLECTAFAGSALAAARSVRGVDQAAESPSPWIGMAIATVGATEAVRPGHRLLSAHGVAHVAVEAVVRKSDPALIAVAVGAGRDEVSPAERPSGLIVIEA